MDDMDLLKKIDIIRARANVGYKEAKDVLDEAGGDLIKALIHLEEERESWAGKLQDKGVELLHILKDVYEKGAHTRIRLKRDDKTLFEVPAGVGLLGLAGMLVSGELAVLGAVGTLTAMLSRCTLEIGGREDNPAHETGEQSEPSGEG